jgi:hypothetical protein
MSEIEIIQPNEAFTWRSNKLGENNKASPNYKHPDYIEYQYDVERCEDFYEGRRAWISGRYYSNFDTIKLQEYLPKNPAEETEEYFDRARQTLFHNFFRPSVDMFAALISKFDLTDNVSESILINQSNIDLKGSDLISFKTDADTWALRDGFAVIVVSYPENAIANPRPYLNLIERDDLINWDFTYDESGAEKMTLAVIKREETEKINQFASEEIEIRWVYSLDENGFVTTEKYYKSIEKSKPSRGKKTQELELWISYDPPLILRDANQQPLTEIPIVIYSVSDRDAICSAPPLLDLLEKVKCHYQNYSSYQRTIYKLQPTYKRKWADFIPDNPPSLVIGGSLAIECSNGSDVGVLQIDPSAVEPMRQMLSDLRAEIKAEALSFLGQGSVQQTDDEIALKMAQGKASLRKFALRQKSLWQTVFSFWDRWTGVEPTDASIDVDINVLDKPVTPQEVQVVLDAVATGTMDADTGSAKLNQLRWLPEGLKLSAIALPQSIPQTNKVMINKVDDSEDDNDDEVQS